MTEYIVLLDDGARFRVHIDDDNVCRVDGAELDLVVRTRSAETLTAYAAGRRHIVSVEYEGSDLVVETSDGDRRRARVLLAESEQARALLTETKSSERTSTATERTEVPAPIAGSIASLGPAEGAFVQQGEPIVVLEAMKMFNEIPAPRSGVVRYGVAPGQSVRAGHCLAWIAAT